jgi:hypothetical protein
MQIGVSSELLDALQDVQDIAIERGTQIKISIRTEADVERDAYGSIKRLNTMEENPALIVYAYPLEYQPTDRQMEKAGLRESTDAIAWIPTKYFLDAGITFNSIDMVRTTVEAKGVRFQITQKNQVSQFGDEWLYVTCALTCLP